ncbi:MAG: hypothetical protein PHD05_05710 [Sphaerochaetaceae bacterium]|nr:hypothetical protein [Sphaerochaetaceae bacterium]
MITKYRRRMNNILEKILGKKQATLTEKVVPKSEEHELCTNENNQGEGVQLPSGE